MSLTPFCPHYNELPDDLPIFPLPGVLLLPRGQLPLNIFEPRYLAMVDDVMGSRHRLIGMVQPKADGSLYNIGCAGRITTLDETTDGRYLITLSGVIRFSIAEERAQKNGFRRIKPQWATFRGDMESANMLDIDRDKLIHLLGEFFDHHGLNCDWEAIKGAPDDRLMTCLAMVCPFEAGEKQALLEAGCCKERAKLFMTLLEIAATRPSGEPLETKH